MHKLYNQLKDSNKYAHVGIINQFGPKWTKNGELSLNSQISKTNLHIHDKCNADLQHKDCVFWGGYVRTGSPGELLVVIGEKSQHYQVIEGKH